MGIMSHSETSGNPTGPPSILKQPVGKDPTFRVMATQPVNPIAPQPLLIWAPEPSHRAEAKPPYASCQAHPALPSRSVQWSHPPVRDPKIWAIKAVCSSATEQDRRGGSRDSERQGVGVLSYHCANHCHIHLLNKHASGTQCVPGASWALGTGQGVCRQQRECDFTAQGGNCPQQLGPQFAGPRCCWRQGRRRGKGGEGLGSFTCSALRQGPPL